MVFSLAFSAASAAAPQGLSEISEKLSRTGVYFRADAPRVLRNSADAYLPLYLEIINGVEKTAHTTGTALSQHVKRDPLKLDGVNVYAKPGGTKHEFAAEPILLGASQDFSLDLRAGNLPLVVTDRIKKVLQIPLAKIEDHLNKRYLGGPFEVVSLRVAFRVQGWPTQDTYLRVRLHAPPQPQLDHWYRGDLHYHSAFTDNPAERGAPLQITKQSALDAGLDWVVLTDHSTDLNAERYADEMRQVAELRDGRFVFIRGEELTVASGKDTLLTTVHLLALPSPDDPDKGFPDASSGTGSVVLTGDGSVASPALPVKSALERVAAAGGFAYAAHPFDPVSPLIRGGSWDLDVDLLAPGGRSLQPGIAGLELWNRATLLTADDARDPFCQHREADPAACFLPDAGANQYARLEKAIDLGWRPLLLKGLAAAGPGTSPFKVFLAAGSDAHGDLNYEATMDVVDFIGKPSRGLSGYAEDNALGKLSTVVFCPDGMGVRGENVLRALRQGRSVTSNGPLLVAGFDSNSNGTLDDAEDVVIGGQISSLLSKLPPLQIQWASNEEFGPLNSLRLIVGASTAESSPEEIPFPASKGLTSGGLFKLDLQPRLEKSEGPWIYIRLEARTRNRAGEVYRCYTNPVWVRLEGK